MREILSVAVGDASDAGGIGGMFAQAGVGLPEQGRGDGADSRVGGAAGIGVDDQDPHRNIKPGSHVTSAGNAMMTATKMPMTATKGRMPTKRSDTVPCPRMPWTT